MDFVEEPQLKYGDITGKIIGAAMEVHRTLGLGFQELIYQRALYLELQERELNFLREPEVEIKYKGKQIGTRRADFLVEDKVLVEIKALSALEDVHTTQILNYIVAYQLEVGLLINFGAASLEFKRLVNTKHPYRNQINQQ